MELISTRSNFRHELQAQCCECSKAHRFAVILALTYCWLIKVWSALKQVRIVAHVHVSIHANLTHTKDVAFTYDNVVLATALVADSCMHTHTGTHTQSHIPAAPPAVPPLHPVPGTLHHKPPAAGSAAHAHAAGPLPAAGRVPVPGASL
jgi:hypothetical protein